MTYNRKELCQLAGVAYTALQSLERRLGQDPFQMFLWNIVDQEYEAGEKRLYNEADVVALALAGALSSTVSDVPGLSLGDAIELVGHGFTYWCDDYIRRDRPSGRTANYYFGVATRDDSVTAGYLLGATAAEAVAWAGEQPEHGVPAANRIYLINIEAVLRGVDRRSKEAGVAFDVAEV